VPADSQTEAAAPAIEICNGVCLQLDSGPDAVVQRESSAVPARRFVHETAEYHIDIRVERGRGAGARVVGKITRRGIAKQLVWEDLGVCLLDGKSAIVATFTNQRGEFQLEFDVANRLCVSVSRDQLDEVVLPLYGIQVIATNRKGLD
jgi:hypothetical protein